LSGHNALPLRHATNRALVHNSPDADRNLEHVHRYTQQKIAIKWSLHVPPYPAEVSLVLSRSVYWFYSASL